MTLEELKEQLQENLIMYLEEMPLEFYQDRLESIIDGVCDIVITTFDESFYAEKPLDKSPELALCLDCGEPAQVCLCEE